MQQTLDAMTRVPALVQNGRLDIIAANRLGFAVFSALYVQPERPANFARFVFLDPQAQTLYRDWKDAAHQTVALLRSEAGRAPYDRALTDLIGELSTRSELSESCGHHTTSASTARASNESTIRWWATSISTMRA